MLATTMILAGDIGGTKVNLAFFGEDLQLKPENFASFHSRDFKSLDEIAHRFLTERSLRADFACFGIAGPVRKGRAQLTNLPWVVDARELTGILGLKNVWLINDLEANAYGIGGLRPNDFVILNAGEENAVGDGAIISAGTGLGEAALVWDGKRHLPVASEGGHCDFAPRTDLDVELLKYLRAKLGQVSWEHVLSGAGSVRIYEFLRDTRRGEEPAWLKDQMGSDDPAKVITVAALENKSDLCVQALDIFVSYYGAEASNLALKMLATGGVYVGGGIAPKIIEKLKDGTFMKSFIGAGRMKDLLEAVPVRVIMNDKTALLGAGRYAAMQSGKIL